LVPASPLFFFRECIFSFFTYQMVVKEVVCIF